MMTITQRIAKHVLDEHGGNVDMDNLMNEIRLAASQVLFGDSEHHFDTFQGEKMLFEAADIYCCVVKENHEYA